MTSERKWYDFPGTQYNLSKGDKIRIHNYGDKHHDRYIQIITPNRVTQITLDLPQLIQLTKALTYEIMHMERRSLTTSDRRKS